MSAVKEDKIEVKAVKTVKPFIEPVVIPKTAAKDPSVVEGMPKKYEPMWLNKNELAGNSKGHYRVVDKTHPDFKDVRVSRDDTPDGTMFTRGDLVLGVTHRDTYKQILKNKAEKVARRAAAFDAKDKDNLARIGKEGVDSIDSILRNEEG